MVANRRLASRDLGGLRLAVWAKPCVPPSRVPSPSRVPLQSGRPKMTALRNSRRAPSHDGRGQCGARAVDALVQRAYVGARLAADRSEKATAGLLLCLCPQTSSPQLNLLPPAQQQLAHGLSAHPVRLLAGAAMLPAALLLPT